MIQSRDKTELLGAFLKFAIPSVIGMFLTSFIVIVDGMFIAWGVGEAGLAAVNITLPVFYVFLGTAIMIGAGGSTIAAQCLGEKNFIRADRAFTFTVVLNIAINSVLLILLILFEENLMNILNAKEAVLPYVRDYMRVIKYYYFLSTVNIVLSVFIRSEGKPQFALLFSILGNILNIILDYVFVLRLGYGMKGAALASCAAVFIPLILGALYFILDKSVFHFTAVRFVSGDFKSIMYNGSSEFISQLSISITTYLFNLVIIRRIGITGVAAFAVIGYISFIESMILSGIAQGIHPIMSYNYGAKNKETIMILLNIGIKACLYVGVVTFAVSFGASEVMVKVFSKGQTEFISIARYGLRIFCFSFLFNGYNTIASTYFTSLGDARTSALISSLRSLILISILLMILPPLMGDTGIWAVVPLTEIATLVVSFLYIRRSKETLSFAAAAQ